MHYAQLQTCWVLTRFIKLRSCATWLARGQSHRTKKGCSGCEGPVVQSKTLPVTEPCLGVTAVSKTTAEGRMSRIHAAMAACNM